MAKSSASLCFWSCKSGTATASVSTTRGVSSCTMLFMIPAYDISAIYLAIELQSSCFHVIAASKGDSEFYAEAGSIYLILGAFSTGMSLFGCSVIYGFTGVTNFEEDRMSNTLQCDRTFSQSHPESPRAYRSGQKANVA